MKNNSNIYFSVIVFFLLNVLLVIFLIYPMILSLKKDSADLINQKNQIYSLSVQSASLSQAEEFYASHQAELENIENLFIDAHVPIEFIRFLEDSAREFQLVIKISSLVSTPKTSDYWQSFAFQISTIGSFEGTAAFLEQLENGPYLVEIESLNQGTTQENNVIASLFSVKAFSKNK